MARFNYNESEFYGAPKSNYFSLKDDGDTAKIRFLINDINDLEGVAVHEVQVGDKTMDVECLRAYNEPVDNCPLCAANYKQNAKLFIPVYDESSKESKIWTRGRTFFKKLSSLCARYNPLVGTSIEVERVGKKGETSTDYQFYPGNTDNAKVTDFPEVKAEGICFQTKTYEELQNYVQTGTFEMEQPQRGNRHEQPVRRQVEREMPVRRRPIAYNEEDNF